MRVGAAAEEAEREAVLLGALGHQARHCHFAAPFGQGVEAVAGFQVGGDFIEQVLDAVGANRLEHGLDVVRGMGNVGHGAFPGRKVSIEWLRRFDEGRTSDVGRLTQRKNPDLRVLRPTSDV